MMRDDTYNDPVQSSSWISGNNVVSINYSEYFVMKMKEYLMKMPSKNKLFFILKILLLLNWDKTYSFFYGKLKKYYTLKIKRYVPRLSFYKTNIKRIESIVSSKIPQIVHKYVKDKSLLVQYRSDGHSDEYYIGQDGVEFDHDDVHYYCYKKNGKFVGYVLDCFSNLSYDETSKRINKMFTEFKPENVYIYDGSIIDLGTFSTNKIDRTMDSIFLQEDVEKEIQNFVSKYDNFKVEYKRLGILYKNTFLVHGKPGTGKTTLAKVIASELKRDIVLFNLKDIKNIRQLQGLINKHVKAVIVFEELDCLIERIKKRNEQKQIFKNKSKKVDGYYSHNNEISKNIKYMSEEQDKYNSLNEYDDDLDLSDFLEILDGMRSTEDSIMFFTTNHINRIDPAFKRQGRVNYLIEMKLCNKYQFSKIYKSILQNNVPIELYDMFREYRYSPSNVIETMLKNIFDLKQGTLLDLKLLELIELNHINFISTIDCYSNTDNDSVGSNNELHDVVATNNYKDKNINMENNNEYYDNNVIDNVGDKIENILCDSNMSELNNTITDVIECVNELRDFIETNSHNNDKINADGNIM
ncbi:bifunctional aaa family atpase chaperone translocase bcs1 [Tupanvirus deep ocean]|uniref:Bifunctional aaa family atpase chaperone translocase bcs1 n=2 Tax=Tupanvirus TaxID=2094720 RepID=A0AC62A9D4_9VIRU|nr:bifunctional aaa family atpase chaperone translocase bcs1 [Tupanvirus deep ocean]QKU34238.1 bifunctional aaa family atpase chaperone translocase bcs1 [Tupanvirus deep ocean]